MIRKKAVIASQCAHWRSNPHREIRCMEYYVYIMTNAHKTVVYTGVTNDLLRRVSEHKHHLDKHSFTAQYNVEYLVYYESTPDINAAIEREKQIKGWSRKRKNKLIEYKNPAWNDLYPSIV